jgi:hypothetical protein
MRRGDFLKLLEETMKRMRFDMPYADLKISYIYEVFG